ncbi:MAG: hypothetical protein SNH64_06675, partial [Rikenellaceae bacterium]
MDIISIVLALIILLLLVAIFFLIRTSRRESDQLRNRLMEQSAQQSKSNEILALRDAELLSIRVQ